MEMRKFSHKLVWHYNFSHNAESIWPLVSNTDRLNRSIGLSQVEYKSLPDANGGSQRYGKTKIAGFDLEWLEYPYEWIINQSFAVQRDYSKGPLKTMDISWQIKSTDSGCKIIQTVAFKPSSILFLIISYLQIYFLTRPSFLKAYRQIDVHLSNLKKTPFILVKNDGPKIDVKKYNEIIEQLREMKINDTLAEKLTSHIFESAEPDLVRIKPFVLAKNWSIDRLEVLKALLKGTNRGIFSLFWDLVCPRCRGAKSRIDRLTDARTTHCDSCNIDFTVDLAKSVEVTFSVHPRVRKITVGEYCVGGPQNTPHFMLQVRLAPNEEKQVILSLNQGLYRVRSLQSKGGSLLDVKDHHPGESTSVIFGEHENDESRSQIKTNTSKLLLKNLQSHESVVTVTCVTWMEDICSAAFVTSITEFRNRFADDVLNSDQQISVSRVAILFTDLKGSTKMYQDIGDAKAYRLVRSHFDILSRVITRHEGSIVKTLGDAVMATFSEPASALKAALEIRGEIKMHAELNDFLKIKIGIHAGSCFMINSDSQIDYFGTNVNIAARTNGHCEGDDIILTQYMMNDLEVQHVLSQSNIQIEKIIRNFKGFDDHFVLYQIKLAENKIKVA
jgi:adenylate cyclase